MINIQSTLYTTPDLCKDVSLAILFGSNGKLYTLSMQADICIFTHICQTMEMVVW